MAHGTCVIRLFTKERILRPGPWRVLHPRTDVMKLSWGTFVGRWLLFLTKKELRWLRNQWRSAMQGAERWDVIYYCCCPQTSLENLENLDCERSHILLRDRRASEINRDLGPVFCAKACRDGSVNLDPSAYSSDSACKVWETLRGRSQNLAIWASLRMHFYPAKTFCFFLSTSLRSFVLLRN